MERRRAIKGGFATQKDCQAAMNRLLVAVEESRFRPPTKMTVKEYLIKEWLPAVKATVRPSTYASYVQHVEHHIVPHLGTVKLAKLTGRQSTPSTRSSPRTAKDGKRRPLSHDGPPASTAVFIGLRDAVRWGYLARNPLDAAHPPCKNGDGTKEMRTWTAEQLKAFSTQPRTTASMPSGT